MKNWQDTWPIVEEAWEQRERYIATHWTVSESFVQEYFKELNEKFGPGTFRHGVDEFRIGNSKPLIKYLRSEYPIADVEREYLADVLDGKFEGRGRPAKSELKYLAGLSSDIFDLWRNYNDEHNVEDGRARAKMKDAIVEFVLEKESLDQSYFDPARSLLDRGKSRYSQYHLRSPPMGETWRVSPASKSTKK